MDKIIEIAKYRKPEFITEEQVWALFNNLDPKTMLIVTNIDGILKIAQVSIHRFQTKPEDL